MLQNLTGWHALIVLAVVILLFGAAKLPALAKSVGQSMRILKTEVGTTDRADRADRAGGAGNGDGRGPAGPSASDTARDAGHANTTALATTARDAQVPNTIAANTTALTTTMPDTTAVTIAQGPSAR